MRIALTDGWVDGEGGAVHRPVADHLRPKELALLRYLAARPGTTIGRAELYSAVWGYHPDSRSRTLDTTVRRLREAIERDPASPTHLLTEPAVGYRFAPPPHDPDLAVAHADAGVRGLRPDETVVLWGPPGVGRTFWLQRSGLPGVDDATGPVPGLSTRRVRPHEPGVRAVEVTPLPPAAARALVEGRLAALGASVACPADLSPWDGLPAALLAAADRADLVGTFTPTTDDPLSRRFAALVCDDPAFGGLAAFPRGLPADVVVDVVGEAVVRGWIDRGVARREGLALQPLAHAARVATPAPAVERRLAEAAEAVFRAVVHPDLGPTTTLARARARAAAGAVPGHPWARVITGRPVEEPPGTDGFAAWARTAADARRVLDRLSELPAGPTREALATMARRRAGALDLGPPPPEADRSPEAGEWHYQWAMTASFLGDHESAAAGFERALDRWRGHDLLEARVAGGLAHAQLQLGRVDEAHHTNAALLGADDDAAVEGELGLAFTGLLRGDEATVARYLRAARDRVPALSPSLGRQVLLQVMVGFRELGDHENARAVGLAVLRSPAALPAAVERHAHYAFAHTLLDAGDPEGALVHFARVRGPDAGDLGPAAAIGAAMAVGLLGRRDEAREQARQVAALPLPDSRTGRLTRALAAGGHPLAPEEVRALVGYADATRDPALRGVVRLAAGPCPPDDPDGRLSSEIRVARRWFTALRGG